MKNYKIYCHIFPNGKRYFGQTKRDLEERFGKNGSKYKDCPLLWNAIQKYKWENIQHVLIKDGLTQEEANLYEQAYIKSYRTYDERYGYNLALGGAGNSGYDYNQIYDLWLKGYSFEQIEEKIKCSQKTIRKALDSFGIDGKTRISKAAGKYHTYPIYQYTIEGIFLSSYNSISEAEQITKISHANIQKVINGERRSAGGFRWSKEKVDKLPIYIYNSKNKIKPVKKYDLNGVFIQEYSSANQAAFELTGKKNNGAAISRVCRNLAKTAHGYKWSY